MSARTLLAALVALALVGAAGVALAQEDEPTLNESDFDTEPPAEDDAYLEDDSPTSDASGDANESTGSTGDAGGSASNETGEEPALAESDFDTSPPAYDDAWLDDESDLAGTGAADADADAEDDAASKSDRDTASTGDAGAAKKPTPGAGVIAAVGALAGLALAVRAPARPKA